jgi:hypothetical protein
VLEAPRIHEPALIGDVGLSTRSMWWKRSGRPRSEMSSGGLAAAPASATSHARRASDRSPRSSLMSAKGAAAPAVPPQKKYTGISHVHVGCLRIGRP